MPPEDLVYVSYVAACFGAKESDVRKACRDNTVELWAFGSYQTTGRSPICVSFSEAFRALMQPPYHPDWRPPKGVGPKFRYRNDYGYREDDPGFENVCKHYEEIGL